MKGYEVPGKSRRIALLFLYLGARCGWVVHETWRPFYSRETNTGKYVGSRAPLDGYKTRLPHQRSKSRPFSL